MLENMKNELLEINFLEDGITLSTMHGVKIKFTNGRVKVDVAEYYSGMVRTYLLQKISRS